MIDLNEMAIFVEIANHASFTGAANKLEMPLSTISRKMSQLESRLNVRLLERTTRKLRLTDIGNTYFEHCQRMMAEVDDAEHVVKSLQKEPSGNIRVQSPFAFDSSFAGNLTAEFMNTYPKVNLELIHSTQHLDLIEHRIDCAFMVGSPKDSAYIARNFGSVEAYLCASPKYLNKKGIPKSLADLHKHTLIGLPLISWDFQNNEKNTEEFNFRIKTTEMTMARQFVQDGCGIGLLPSIHIQELLAEGKIEQVLPEYFRRIDISLVYPSNRQMSTKLRCFIDFHVEGCRQNAPWNFPA